MNRDNAAAASDDMNFALPEDLRMLKEVLRKFVDRELIPIELRACDGHKLRPEVRAHLEAKAKELGLWNYDIPREYGGLGYRQLARALVWAELSRSVALPTRNVNIFGPIVSPMLYRLDDRQKERYLLPTLRGEIKWCFAQTEPDAGSDPSSMRTTAVRRGDAYIISGAKRFITDAGDSDYAQVIAATDRSKGSHGGISAFIVDMKSPGVKLLRQQKLVIEDRPWEIAFDNVEVPAENRVGKEGEGFKDAQDVIAVQRLRHGARAIGVMERCLELGASYAKQRVTFGRPLADRQAVQWMLADTYLELHQLRLMVYQAAWKHERGEDIRVEAYMVKNFGDEKSFLAADRCMQIHGGIGMADELPIEKFWRNQRSMRITEGATEVLKSAIARQVLNEFG
ncbi:MAG: acyl-CoA/acyl-ACP dehydrogenase [Betaproteobacteria bacterium]|nr:acyl-CoA/acyl-ACP dehydrogenase [Betaproteobacteria bacterium]